VQAQRHFSGALFRFGFGQSIHALGNPALATNFEYDGDAAILSPNYEFDMKNFFVASFCFVACACVPLGGCDSKPTPVSGGVAPSKTTAPEFKLAWSEYPSWSVFGVASDVGLIDGELGKMGSIEKKHNIDIVLKGVSYDTCISLYGTSEADAVCITNIDILGPAASRKSVAILPTSTSNGADACIVSGIDSVDALIGKETRGLEKSVSQYCFDRCLEKLGKTSSAFPFVQMDPEQAAQAFQSKEPKIQSIMVWNPYVMKTLVTRPDSKVLFDSTSIPEEIIDMVVIGADSLKKPGGKEFAAAIVETFYAMNERMKDPATMDKTLVGIGEKFAQLKLEDMKTVVQQTRFYSDPAEAKQLFGSERFQKETMGLVSKFCEKYGLTTKPTSISYGTGDGMIDFNTTYLKK
jgi:ABC-type nitrate/sulfonate/bicarbonate transport system substrate-binding protein